MNCLVGGSHLRRKPDERTLDVEVETEPAAEEGRESVDFFFPPEEERLACGSDCFLDFDLGLDDEDMLIYGDCVGCCRQLQKCDHNSDTSPTCRRILRE